MTVEMEKFHREIRTDITINADTNTVWNVLVSLEHYPDWNPMIRSARGNVANGEILTLRFNPPGTRPNIFRPKLIVVEPERELRWLGIPRVPKVFDSEHYFAMERIAPEKTFLRHNMLFYGLVIPAIWPFFNGKIAGYFKLMNDAHKRRAEDLFAKSGT